LTLVLDVVAIETLGLVGFFKYREGLRYSSGGRIREAAVSVAELGGDA
jgi:hypothetical protein